VHGADQGRVTSPLSFTRIPCDAGAAATAWPGAPAAGRATGAAPCTSSRSGMRISRRSSGPIDSRRRRLLRARGRQRLETGAVLGAHSGRPTSTAGDPCARPRAGFAAGFALGAQPLPKIGGARSTAATVMAAVAFRALRSSACLSPHPSRGRSSRARRIVHAPDLPVPPLAAARCTAAAGRPRSVGQVLLSVRRAPPRPDTGTPGRRPPARARGRNPPRERGASPPTAPSRRERLSHTHPSVLNCRTVRNCQSSKMVDHRIS